MWTYEGYWNAVIGAHRDAARTVFELGLKAGDDLGECLCEAESRAWTAGGHDAEPQPAEWDEFHKRAVRELSDALQRREARMDALTHYWVVGHAAQHEIAADVEFILKRPPVNPDDVFEGMTDAELAQLCRSYELKG